MQQSIAFVPVSIALFRMCTMAAPTMIRWIMAHHFQLGELISISMLYGLAHAHLFNLCSANYVTMPSIYYWSIIPCAQRKVHIHWEYCKHMNTRTFTFIKYCKSSLDEIPTNRLKVFQNQIEPPSLYIHAIIIYA